MRKWTVLALASALILVLAGPVWAVEQKDLELKFGTQIETDFEVKDNYDFNNDAKDVNPGDDGFFVQQESRFWMDATAGPFSTRIMIEAEVFWDTDTLEGDPTDPGGKDIAVEQAWGAYDFDIVNVRIGGQLFTLDPIGMVYTDDDYGIRLWDTYDWGDWNFFWAFSQEGSDDPGITAHDDRHFLMGNANIKVDGWVVTPFIGYVLDRGRGNGPGPTDGKTGRFQDIYWLGGNVRGEIPNTGLQVMGQFVYVTGEQDLTTNTASADLSLDIQALMGFASVAYPIPNSPLTVEVAGVWMSGDDDPTDGDGEAYAGIFNDPEVLNPQGIWIDDTVKVAPQVGNVSQDCRARTTPCTGTFNLTVDDSVGPRDDMTFDAGGTSATFNSASPANPGNYGIQYYHGAVHYKATPELRISGMYAHVRAMEDKLLGGDSHLGDELTLHAVWQPHTYLKITPTIAYFLPGDAVDNIVGEDDGAFHFIVETRFQF